MISGGGVDHDTPYAVTHRRPQVAWRLGVSVQHDPVSREAHRTRHRELACRADVQRQALLRDPSGHGAAQERLAGVGDLRAGKRGGSRSGTGTGRRPRRGCRRGCRRRAASVLSRRPPTEISPSDSRRALRGQRSAARPDRLITSCAVVAVSPHPGSQVPAGPAPRTSSRTSAVDTTSTPPQPRTLVSTVAQVGDAGAGEPQLVVDVADDVHRGQHGRNRPQLPLERLARLTGSQADAGDRLHRAASWRRVCQDRTVLVTARGHRNTRNGTVTTVAAAVIRSIAATAGSDGKSAPSSLSRRPRARRDYWLRHDHRPPQQRT